MEQGRKKMYTVKHPGRLVVVVVISVGMILLALAWALFFSKVTKRTADLSAYTTLTRTGETVTAVLDVDSLLTELALPDPRTDEKAARNGAVKALLNMKLQVAFTEEPDVMAVSVEADERTLKLWGITLQNTSWAAQVKVLPRTTTQEEAPETPPEPEKPKTVLADGYLTSLLDEDGKGLNLRKVFERFRFERDRLAKELFGSSYVTKRTKLWFIVYPEGSARKNCCRAVYALSETGAPEGRSIGSCYFTVDLLDLSYRAGSGVAFTKADVVLFDTALEAEDLSTLRAQGCEIVELIGGSMVGPVRPTFDYNGFVRFVGLPMSHPLPDGSLWSPSVDELEEDDLWRLVDNGQLTMVEQLAYVRMEIFARHGYTFPQPDQASYREHYGHCAWYTPTEDAPERFMTSTERKNLELIRELETLLDS